jgi:hypothetical protein
MRTSLIALIVIISLSSSSAFAAGGRSVGGSSRNNDRDYRSSSRNDSRDRSRSSSKNRTSVGVEINIGSGDRGYNRGYDYRPVYAGKQYRPGTLRIKEENQIRALNEQRGYGGYYPAPAHYRPVVIEPYYGGFCRKPSGYYRNSVKARFGNDQFGISFGYRW